MSSSSSWTAGPGATIARVWPRASCPWATEWRRCSGAGTRTGDGRAIRHPPPLSSPCPGPASPRLAQLVPGERRRLLAPLAGQLLAVGPERLPVAAGRAHGVGEREQATHPLDLPRLAAHDAPALGRMIADLEEPTVHRHVAPIHVQHHDVARGDTNDGVPRAATQQVRTGPPDARPSLGLKTRGSHRTEGHGHAWRITPRAVTRSDLGHTS